MDQATVSTIQTAITGISAVAVSASAFFTARALRANNEATRAAFESQRPYFTFSGFGLERLKVAAALTSQTEMLDPTRVVVEGLLANRGRRPAANVSGALFILPLDSRREVRVFPIGVGDDVASGTEWQVRSGDLQIFPPDFPGRDAAPEYRDPGFFICAAVQYDDLLASKHCGQLSFMRWPGISGSVVAGNLIAANKEERDTLLAKHSALLQPYRETKR